MLRRQPQLTTAAGCGASGSALRADCRQHPAPRSPSLPPGSTRQSCQTPGCAPAPGGWGPGAPPCRAWTRSRRAQAPQPAAGGSRSQQGGELSFKQLGRSAVERPSWRRQAALAAGPPLPWAGPAGRPTAFVMRAGAQCKGYSGSWAPARPLLPCSPFLQRDQFQSVASGRTWRAARWRHVLRFTGARLGACSRGAAPTSIAFREGGAACVPLLLQRVDWGPGGAREGGCVACRAPCGRMWVHSWGGGQLSLSQTAGAKTGADHRRPVCSTAPRALPQRQPVAGATPARTVARRTPGPAGVPRPRPAASTQVGAQGSGPAPAGARPRPL